MFKKLSKERYHDLLNENKHILVYKQFPGDMLTPVQCYKSLAPADPSALIEIHYPQEDYHYSFIGHDPYLTYEVKNGAIMLRKDKETELLSGDPLELLWQISQRELAAGADIFPNFLGGFLGFMSFDAIRLFEKIETRHQDLDNFPDLLFHAFRAMLCYDHKTGLLTIGKVSSPAQETYEDSMQEIDKLYSFLLKPQALEITKPFKPKNIEADVEIDDTAFRDLVKEVQGMIQNGDVKKTIISRTFSRSYEGTALNLFRASRMLNPSPCHFLLSYPGFSLVGASPGKLISVIGRELEITPLAGTYPRKSPREDKATDEQLLHDPKETDEHMMLVDAVKEDLSKVSEPGSVHVSKLKVLEHFSHVTHIVSYVNGTLGSSYHPLDAFKASFPAGTLSGIPRIKALEIIDKLEHSRRGIYSGAVCALDSRGNLDSVLINRTAILKNGKAFVRAGAGVVLSSDPQKEADESRHKAKAMLESLNAADLF